MKAKRQTALKLTRSRAIVTFSFRTGHKNCLPEDVFIEVIRRTLSVNDPPTSSPLALHAILICFSLRRHSPILPSPTPPSRSSPPHPLFLFLFFLRPFTIIIHLLPSSSSILHRFLLLRFTFFDPLLPSLRPHTPLHLPHLFKSFSSSSFSSTSSSAFFSFGLLFLLLNPPPFHLSDSAFAPLHLINPLPLSPPPVHPIESSSCSSYTSFSSSFSSFYSSSSSSSFPLLLILSTLFLLVLVLLHFLPISQSVRSAVDDEFSW